MTKMCVVCRQRPGVVPDRNKPGAKWGQKDVCRQCHAERLMGDLNTILTEHYKRAQSDPSGGQG